MIRKVKSLKDIPINENQILSSLLLGDVTVNKYSETSTYNIGNIIIKLDSDNRYRIYECNDDNVTGIFNELKWDVKEQLLDAKGVIDCGIF